jgi:NhaA family Na+:H+ antiporter
LLVRTSSGDRTAIDRLLSPFRRFAAMEMAGGLALLGAAAVAVAWANGPWSEAYHVWETPLTVAFGGASATLTLHQVVNDGLMAIFFFLVGLEIKREMRAGELSSPRTAALPILAALGGMVVPAALYMASTFGGPGLRGWGVPMATDIAFALGVLALVGRRVPSGVKVFLAALAIADDLGAILVIALFYSTGIAWGWLAAAAGMLGIAWLSNVAGVRHPGAYAAIGGALWLATVASGVHATVAGVLLAMAIPVRVRIDEEAFVTGANDALDDFTAAAAETVSNPETTVLSNRRHHAALHEMERLCERAQPPLIRIEHSLHGLVTFGIMPIFALANAGVSLGGGAIGIALASPVTTGVFVGLLLGKPIGIIGFSWLAVRLKLASLPSGVTWRMLAGAGALGGIGFTMALFIAGLAFGEGDLLYAAKIGVLGASVCSAIVGWLLLSGAQPKPGLRPAPTE